MSRPAKYGLGFQTVPPAVPSSTRLADDAGAVDEWLDGLDPTDLDFRDANTVRAIIAAVEQLAAAEQTLRKAVADARAAGDSWTVIGAALGTTRQAAQMRFRTDKGAEHAERNEP